MADETILPGELISEYCGEILTAGQARLREEFYMKSPEHDGNSYLIFNKGNAVDAQIFGNASRYANHSCSPNSAFGIMWKSGATELQKNRVGIFCKKPIMRGEEITINYGDGKAESEIPCHCGSEVCLKFL